MLRAGDNPELAEAELDEQPAPLLELPEGALRLQQLAAVVFAKQRRSCMEFGLAIHQRERGWSERSSSSRPHCDEDKRDLERGHTWARTSPSSRLGT